MPSWGSRVTRSSKNFLKIYFSFTCVWSVRTPPACRQPQKPETGAGVTGSCGLPCGYWSRAWVFCKTPKDSKLLGPLFRPWSFFYLLNQHWPNFAWDSLSPIVGDTVTSTVETPQFHLILWSTFRCHSPKFIPQSLLSFQRQTTDASGVTVGLHPDKSLINRKY